MPRVCRQCFLGIFVVVHPKNLLIAGIAGSYRPHLFSNTATA